MQGFYTLVLGLMLVVGVHAQTVTIMIDPGHGGSDPGHLSENEKHLQEKDLNLIIAKKFGTYLSTKLSNVKVIYTRTEDVYPSLDERVNMANNNKVDYFISVHCNGAGNKAIRGTESHVHSMSSLKSVRLAKEFEKEFSTKGGRPSRGVKDTDDREHTLQVLKFTQMTSVLVECGFLTNVKEANYLNTVEGQDVLASALFRGMRTFLKANHPKISFTNGGGSVAEKSSSGKSGSSYSVQLMSSREEINTADSRFRKTGKDVKRDKVSSKGYKYRYLIGPYSDKQSAEKVRDEVRKKGFPDAMVVKTG